MKKHYEYRVEGYRLQMTSTIQDFFEACDITIFDSETSDNLFTNDNVLDDLPEWFDTSTGRGRIDFDSLLANYPNFNRMDFEDCIFDDNDKETFYSFEDFCDFCLKGSGHEVEKRFEWYNMTPEITERRKVLIRDKKLVSIL